MSLLASMVFDKVPMDELYRTVGQMPAHLAATAATSQAISLEP
ncbi:hypothetical protein [Bradyrhizobium sp. 197]|nr:hypothetical protein [Bradyrhizobium sp. 197]